jgi:small subunit ribosomal protein S9
MSKPLNNSTGRRKTAIARVHILAGSGSITVNGRDFEEYFPSENLEDYLEKCKEWTLSN